MVPGYTRVTKRQKVTKSSCLYVFVVYMSDAMQNLALRGALAFGLPVLLVFAFTAWRSPSAYVIAAGPLCGIVGGLVFRRRWGMPIVLGLCYAAIGFMFYLSAVRAPWFSDVIGAGLVSGFLFWTAGGCAML